MGDNEKTRTQLLAELVELRERIAVLETVEATRRRTEEELHDSRRMLQLVLDTIPQRVFWKGRDFSYLGCNKAFAEDAGLEDPNVIFGKNDFDLGWKDVAQLYRDDDARVMNTDSPKLDFEEPQTTPGGTQRWLKTSKVPLHDKGANVIGVLGTYEDITERKQTEAIVERERNLLRTLIDNLPDLIYFKDAKGRYLLSNKSHLRSMGAKRQEDVLGKTTFDFNPHELAAHYTEDEMQVVRTGKGLFEREELALHRDTGEERWHLTTKVPLVNSQGEVTGIVGISRDITERKQSQEALQHERNLLRTLIDNLPDLIFFKDTEGRYLLNNRSHLRSMGVEHQEDVIGKTTFDFNPHGLAAHYTEDEAQVVRTGNGLFEREELALHRDTGEQRWHLTTKVPLVDSQGEVTGIVGIARDVTERKSIEAEREKLIAELQRALADVKMLSGLVPICANCKKIRDDKGYWTQLEGYIQDRSEARFSHGICPDCIKKFYPEYDPTQRNRPPHPTEEK